MDKFMEWFNKNKKLVLIGGGVAVLLVSFFVVRFAISNSITNEGNKKEAELNAQYLNDQNFLSDCVIKIRESAGVVKGQTAALDQVLTDAVTGRYSAPGAPQVDSGKLFSAIVEAYPDLSGLSNGFDKVLVVINGCRTDFRGQQTQLLQKLELYDKWRTGGFWEREFADGFPSNNLKARIGTKIVTGQEAYDQMNLIVTVNGTDEAFNTGETQAEDPFGTTSTTGG